MPTLKLIALPLVPSRQWSLAHNKVVCHNVLRLCRMATVEAYTKLVCLTLRRDDFTQILGPLEKLMTREKSPQVRPCMA